jgi:hypothetical protein
VVPLLTPFVSALHITLRAVRVANTTHMPNYRVFSVCPRCLLAMRYCDCGYGYALLRLWLCAIATLRAMEDTREDGIASAVIIVVLAPVT